LWQSFETDFNPFYLIFLQEREIAEKRYRDVMKCIIRRYITAEQKKAEEFR
jgi:hypothetical protein